MTLEALMFDVYLRPWVEDFRHLSSCNVTLVKMSSY